MEKVRSDSFIMMLNKIAISRLFNVIYFYSNSIYKFDTVPAGRNNIIGAKNLYPRFSSLIISAGPKDKTRVLSFNGHFTKILWKTKEFKTRIFTMFYRKIQPIEQETDEDHHLSH